MSGKVGYSLLDAKNDYEDADEVNETQDQELDALEKRIDDMTTEVNRLESWNPYGYGLATPLYNPAAAVGPEDGFEWVAVSGSTVVAKEIATGQFCVSKDGGGTFSEGIEAFDNNAYDYHYGVITNNLFIVVAEAITEPGSDLCISGFDLQGEHHVTTYGVYSKLADSPEPKVRYYHPSHGIIIAPNGSGECWFVNEGVVTACTIPAVTDMGRGGFYTDYSGALYHFSATPQQIKFFDGAAWQDGEFTATSDIVERVFNVGERHYVLLKNQGDQYTIGSLGKGVDALTVMAGGETSESPFVTLDVQGEQFIAIADDKVVHFGYVGGAGRGKLDISENYADLTGVSVAIGADCVKYLRAGENIVTHSMEFTEVPVVPSNPFSKVRIVEKTTGKEANIFIKDGNLVVTFNGNETVLMDKDGNFIAAGLVQGHIEE